MSNRTYRGTLSWVVRRQRWELAVVDESGRSVRIQPREVFSADTLAGQLRLLRIGFDRIEFTAYTCEVIMRRPGKIDSEARRFITLLRSRYMLHERRHISWHWGVDRIT